MGNVKTFLFIFYNYAFSVPHMQLQVILSDCCYAKCSYGKK